MKSLQHDYDGGDDEDDEKWPTMKKTMKSSVTSFAVPSQQKTSSLSSMHNNKKVGSTTTTTSSSTATTSSSSSSSTNLLSKEVTATGTTTATADEKDKNSTASSTTTTKKTPPAIESHLRTMSSMIINIHPIIYCLLIVFTAVVVWPVQSSQAVFASTSSISSSSSSPTATTSTTNSVASAANPTTTATTTTTTTNLPSRGKYIGSNFQPKDLYEAFREIQNDYEQRAFSTNYQSKWKILTKQKDRNNKKYDSSVEVAMLEDPNDPNCPYVRLSAIIPVPVKECWSFLELDNWDVTMPKMDPFYEGVELHGDYSFEVSLPPSKHHWWQGKGQQQQHQTSNKKSSSRRSQHHKDDHHHQDSTSQNNDMVRMRLARKRTKRILTFSKRDFVFLSVSEETRRLQDGSWISGTISVRTPKLQRQDNYVRAYQDSIAFYKPIITSDNQEEHTQLTIVCRIDLNDNSPSSSIDDEGEGEGEDEEETDDGDNGHMSNELNAVDDTAKGGWIPMWLYVKTIGITGARSITNMRDVLIQQHIQIERQQQRLLSSETNQQIQEEEDETRQHLEEGNNEQHITSENFGTTGSARDDEIINTHQKNTRSIFGSIRRKLAFSKGKRNTR